MSEMTDLLRRIDVLSSRAATGSGDARLLAEMEDLFAEGYVHAMTREARSRRLTTRLERLLSNLDEPDAATEARRLARQRRTLDQSVTVLRSRLAVMREQFVRSGGGAPSQAERTSFS